MNQSISRLFVFLILLFGVLILWTSRWTVFDATALQNNRLNKLSFYASLKIRRGRILADNNEVLARSQHARGGTWTRTYPTGSLFSQAVGFAIPREGQFAGTELHRSRELSGTLQSGLTSVFGPLTTPTAGNDVYTSLDPIAQEEARRELAGRVGSVVAIVPQTGAVKVMYSNPTYDNNHPFICRTTTSVCSQVNYATQGLFPPGSTFKIVTTTAALDTGRYTPNSIINGDSPILVSGVPLTNDGNQSWGPVTLSTALTYSINTVFAQVGEALRKPTMATYMRRFGFYSVPPLDYPAKEMSPSGEWDVVRGRLIPVVSDRVDVGRMAIGQDKLLVTPLQMAMVASAVANGGKLMQPRLMTKAVNQDGQVVESVSPQVDDQVMKPKIAAELTEMMTHVVEEGTGTAAQLGGVQVAGKTGTAQVGGTNSNLDDAWFIGFAPVQDPKIAVAVMLEKIPNGYGGVYAAPIAADVMKTLLAEGQ